MMAQLHEALASRVMMAQLQAQEPVHKIDDEAAKTDADSSEQLLQEQVPTACQEANDVPEIAAISSQAAKNVPSIAAT
jgi:hypothetical protein